MQSALVAASIKSMSDTIAAMGLWMPQVDKSITSLTTSIDEVGVRVAAHHPLDADRTPRSDGHGRDTSHQGVAIGASTAPAHALVRGKREFPHTLVTLSGMALAACRKQSFQNLTGMTRIGGKR